MLAWKPPEYEKWSEARREAWDALPTATDKYYSAYLPPGEKPLPNEWTAKELGNFAKLLNEVCVRGRAHSTRHTPPPCSLRPFGSSVVCPKLTGTRMRTCFFPLRAAAP